MINHDCESFVVVLQEQLRRNFCHTPRCREVRWWKTRAASRWSARAVACCSLVFVLTFWLPAPRAAAQVSFTPLGHLGPPPGAGFRSDAIGVSGVGSVVVGRASSPNLLGGEAFRWTAEGGMVGLGSLSALIPGSSAIAASHDGSVIVGSSNFGAGTQAFRWTTETGIVGLGTLSGGIESLGIAASTSADGTVIVGAAGGAAGNPAGEAFRWSAAEGMRPLADRPPGFVSSRANDVSADGSVIVGTMDVNFRPQAFRWTASAGLAPLPGMDSAEGVSADGSVIVGRAGGVAARWTETGGILQLGDLLGGDQNSSALDVSADGSVIVGSGQTEIGTEAMFLTMTTGMVNLRDSLISQGLDLTGWRLLTAESVSADGLTIVGTGENPMGLREGWVATIPEPSTIVLAALAALVLWTIHLRRTRMAKYYSTLK